MPSRDFLDNQDASSHLISPDNLIESLHDPSSTILILDCRCYSDFAKSHIRGAINVTLPASIIMLRRLSSGKLSVPTLIKDTESREQFIEMWKVSTLVLYDADSESLRHSSSCVFTTLLSRLLDERCTVASLQGGFKRFQSLYPEWCDDSSINNEASPLLGLETLRISTAVVEPQKSDLDSAVGDCSASSSPPFPVEILPNLFLGNASNSSDWESLERHKIHYVLNVTPNLPNAFEKKGLGIKYMQIPIQDHWSQNLASFFPQAIAFINEARQQKLGVLVHCLAGISRSVTITLAYLMHELNIPLNDAYDFVRKRKANISPNFNFLGQLKDFERQLNLSSKSCECSDLCHCQNLHFTSPTKSTPDSGVGMEKWT